MKTRPDPAETVGILSLLGLVAALLSILIPVLLRARSSPLFVGSSLGIFPSTRCILFGSKYYFVYVERCTGNRCEKIQLVLPQMAIVGTLRLNVVVRRALETNLREIAPD